MLFFASFAIFAVKSFSRPPDYNRCLRCMASTPQPAHKSTCSRPQILRCTLEQVLAAGHRGPRDRTTLEAVPRRRPVQLPALFARLQGASAPEETRRHDFLHTAQEFAWAILEKLTPARRVLLLIGVVLLIFPAGGFSFHGKAGEVEVVEFDFRFYGGVVLFVLLMLEIADRVVMKRDLEIARDIQRWLLPATPPPVPGMRSPSPPVPQIPSPEITTMCLPGRFSRRRSQVSSRGGRCCR